MYSLQKGVEKSTHAVSETMPKFQTFKINELAVISQIDSKRKAVIMTTRGLNDSSL